MGKARMLFASALALAVMVPCQAATLVQTLLRRQSALPRLAIH